MLYTRSVTILAQAMQAMSRIAVREFYCTACNGYIGAGGTCEELVSRPTLRRVEELVSRPTELVSRPTLQQKQNKEKQNHCAALKWNVRERSALVAELSSSTTATAAAARAAVAHLLLRRSLFRYTLEPRSRDDGKCNSRRRRAA